MTGWTERISRRTMIALAGAAPVRAYAVMFQAPDVGCALRLHLLGEGAESLIAIEIMGGAEPADQIIVRTLYRQHTVTYGTLYRTKTDVIPFLPGVMMAASDIPAPVKDIVRVEMEVVRRVCKVVEEFER